ncbi:LuxR C-terminal-related transcriptional regulator [Kibdelosporangium aridum]|nr:LuxR C-terminal-related transcriptional regulator [Kibdelosporangium aridum]
MKGTRPPGPLGTTDLDRVLKVLEHSGCEPNLAGFREATVESLGRHFGYQHATFFTGRTVPDLFTDPNPVANGLPPRVVRQYVEDAHLSDPFAQFASLHGYQRDRMVSLDRLAPDSLPGAREYLDSFLFRSGIFAKMVIFLRAPGAAAGIGLLSRESGAFGPRDLAVAQLLSKHLENLFRLYARQDSAVPTKPHLSPRQAEVVDLVARGLTNREIAEALFVTTDTVKKHITHALSVTGCANRTQLALEWGRS